MPRTPAVEENLSPQAHGILLTLSTIGLCLVFVLVAIEHYWLRDLKFDDAWIHFRYGQNIAHGKGFVYNEGQRVLGSGGVLWNLVLAAIARLTTRETLSGAVSILNYLTLVGCSLLAAYSLKHFVPGWQAMLMAAILISHGPLVTSSIGGMETALLCLLYFLSFHLLVREKYILAGFYAGAAFCIRVESLPLVLASLMAVWLYRRMDSLRAFAAAFALPGAIYLWSWAYFGSPIATSTLAKHLVYVVPPGAALSSCIDALLEVFPFDRAFPLKFWFPEAARQFGFLSWLVFIVLGFRNLRHKSRAASLVVLQVALPVVFYVLTNPMMFRWYYCTFVPLGTVLAMLGMLEVGRYFPNTRLGFKYGIGLVLIASFLIFPLRLMWSPFLPADDVNFSAQLPNARECARTYQYANIARWLNEISNSNDRVCISEIGAFGYFYRGKILDGIGLVSPEVLRYHPMPNTSRRTGLYGAIPPEVVREFRPEFVVSMDVFADALFADPWFQRNYELVGRWPWFGGPVAWHDIDHSLWGGSEMLAYRRRDIGRPVWLNN